MVSEWRGGGCPAKRMGLGWWIKGPVGVEGCEQQLLQLLIDLFFFKTFSFLWDVAVIYNPRGLQRSHIVHPALSVRCCCCFSPTNKHTHKYTHIHIDTKQPVTLEKKRKIHLSLSSLNSIFVSHSCASERHEWETHSTSEHSAKLLNEKN